MQSLSKFRTEFNASIVVFLVALPLAMGISIASGYPPVAGLITGIIGGIIVGLISGSPLQVSGAAAGLTVIVFDGVQRFGLATMGAVIILAGLFQMIAAALKSGRLFQAVSPTVLHGMLAGIGILIVAGQFHVMLDLTPAGSGLRNIKEIPSSLSKALSLESSATTFAMLTGLITIAVMVLWPKLATTKLAKLAKVPAPLAAVAAASSFAWMSGFPITFVSIPENLFSDWKLQLPPIFETLQNPAVIGAALQLALIASAESLLCAGAVDQMHDGERTRYNQELAAQGFGNMLCGVLGALPMTGVIVRSSANIQAGATTRWSTVLHGGWLFLFVAVLPWALQVIPVAALAGLLVFTGAKLVNIAAIRELKKVDRSELAIYATTVVAIVAVDLLVGVVIGLALSGLRLLNSLSKLDVTTVQQQGPEIVVTMTGAATFLRLPKLSSTLDAIPPKTNVVLHSEELSLMDHACVKHLEAWRRKHIGSGGQVRFEKGYTQNAILSVAAVEAREVRAES